MRATRQSPAEFFDHLDCLRDHPRVGGRVPRHDTIRFTFRQHILSIQPYSLHCLVSEALSLQLSQLIGTYITVSVHLVMYLGNVYLS